MKFNIAIDFDVNLFIINYTAGGQPDIIGTTMNKTDVRSLYNELKQTTHPDLTIADRLIQAIKDRGFEADYEPIQERFYFSEPDTDD